MRTIANSSARALPLEAIDSEADYVLFSERLGLLSEHCAETEATRALFEHTIGFRVGERVPVIYKREGPCWVRV